MFTFHGWNRYTNAKLIQMQKDIAADAVMNVKLTFTGDTSGTADATVPEIVKAFMAGRPKVMPIR